MPRPHFTSGKDPVPILQEAGWAPGPVWMGRKSRPHRDSILDRPAHSSVAIPTELPADVAVVIGIVVMPLKLNFVVFCLVCGGRWRNALARRRLTNTIRMCSRLLCQIRRCRHQTFLQAKSHHSLLQQDLQCCHNLTNNNCSQQLSPSRRSEHVSSIGCPSRTHTGENILTDK